MLDRTYKQLISGMIALFIVMAISRFAFTPILPDYAISYSVK
ncbi:major facilitator superfamily permease [Staphylococcus gallinarum]|uniref:Major facilitator superfamily permease n=1 Tax=Staphylococcus gallinarum TaxID=1293 RepID=A0A380FK67_STAGA|nr:major facilitator superfamily permease [Staphylococcus gallinarum]